MSEDKEVKDVQEAIERLKRNRKVIRDESEKMAFKVKIFSHSEKSKRLQK
jgi:hypothetical protein